MNCRRELLRPLGPTLTRLGPELRLGDACPVLIWVAGENCPVVETLVEAAAGNRKLRQDVARALGAIQHFSTVEPSRRVPPPWGVAAIGAADVERRIGVREKIWKFGIGGKTRVRIFAAAVDGEEPPAIVLVHADVKSDGQDDWAGVKRALKTLRQGGQG